MEDKGLEKLHVWQKTHELALLICKEILIKFPEEERYALSQQLRWSAQSVPANIAEGYGRYAFQDSIRFLYNARGSLEEVFSQLCLARDLGYPPQDRILEGIVLYKNVVRLLNGYIEYLKRTRDREEETEIREIKGARDYDTTAIYTEA